MLMIYVVFSKIKSRYEDKLKTKLLPDLVLDWAGKFNLETTDYIDIVPIKSISLNLCHLRAPAVFKAKK